MKRFVIWPILIILMSFSLSYSEGALPSLDDLYGAEMPSFRKIIVRDPDNIEILEDGSVKLSFFGVTESCFDKWNSYIDQYGCSLVGYSIDDGILTATIEKASGQITFTYDNIAGLLDIVYPKGSQEEKIDVTGIQNKLDPFQIQGGIVTFGRYEQDDNTENGLEPLEWIVIYTDKEVSLLLCRRAIASMTPVSRSWCDCDIREWLNSSFLSGFFNDEERAAIQLTSLNNTEGEIGTFLGGEDTQDYIFILSKTQVLEYLPDEKDRICFPTEYAGNYKNNYISSNSIDSKTGANEWWVRTVGTSYWDWVTVEADGTVPDWGRQIDYPSFVRPAMWINLSSDYFMD